MMILRLVSNSNRLVVLHSLEIHWHSMLCYVYFLDKKKDEKDSLESRLAPTGEELDEENAGSVHRYNWLSIHKYLIYIHNFNI